MAITIKNPILSILYVKNKARTKKPQLMDATASILQSNVIAKKKKKKLTFSGKTFLDVFIGEAQQYIRYMFNFRL